MSKEKQVVEANMLYCKEDILAELDREIADRMATMNSSRLPAAYHWACLQLLNKLKVEVEKQNYLRLQPQGSWFYCLRPDIYSYKIVLLNVTFDKQGAASLHEVVFTEVKARLLSAEQYGEVYQVGAGSVRQWIRRGKLPQALKVGSVWRISELSLPKGRGYSFRVYTWDKESCIFEKELAFLNDYDAVSLEQLQDGSFLINPRKRNSQGLLANVLPLAKDPDQQGIKMNAKEKESFELQLIENSLVTYETMHVEMDE